METILIQTTSPEEQKLVEEFLARHNLQSRVLSDEDKEDALLLKLMSDTDYTDTIPTNEFLEKLRS